VTSFVGDRALLRPGERVLLMLSGGADSMALLALVRVADERLGLGLELHALHVDYATRGADSERDRLIVSEACAALQVPLETVCLRHKLEGPGFEERARAVRYTAARKLAARHGLDPIVTAHNRDDQAETVLYRLAKYASPGSLVGMRPREGDLARPLLCVGAGEVRAYCRARGIAYGEDTTNADPGYARRNLVRHEVLPALERINPSVAATLAEAAAVAGDERAVLEAAVDEAWERVAIEPVRISTQRAATPEVSPPGEASVSPPLPGASPLPDALDVVALATEPPALRALCLRRLLRGVYGADALIERRLVNGLLRLVESTAGTKRVSLPQGFEAVREYDRLVVRRRGAAAHDCSPVVLAPGREVEFCGRRFAAVLLPEPPGPAHLKESPGEAYLGLARRPAAVVLRHPRDGDEFRPLGMGATVSLADFFSAAKVPARERAGAVVAELDGAVAWVTPGRVAESYRVTDASLFTLHIFEDRGGLAGDGAPAARQRSRH